MLRLRSVSHWFLIVCVLSVAARVNVGAAPEPAPATSQVSRSPGVPASCPAWAKARAPAWTVPFQGRFGLPDPYPGQNEPIGAATAGIDIWQANNFIVWRKETAAFLAHEYTPLRVSYRPGMLPAYEKVLARSIPADGTAREKALAILARTLPSLTLHPSIPPCGTVCPPDRAMSDQQLLACGTSWCNEQARLFVRLCHVAGVPARMIFLFYSDREHGHVVAEFHADGRWSMADTSWFCVFPAADGHLMSAGECHQDEAGKQLAGQAYFARIQEVLKFSDERMVGGQFRGKPDDAQRQAAMRKAATEMRTDLRSKTAAALGRQLWQFGVVNYPLPP